MWFFSVFHENRKNFLTMKCNPACPAVPTCPNLVPGILWDREVIEKRAVSPFSDVVPRIFGKSAFLRPIVPLFDPFCGPIRAHLGPKTFKEYLFLATGT